MVMRVLKSSDFQSNGRIKGMNGPGILLVWAAFCGHCTRFKPTYAQLDARLGDAFNVMTLEDKDMSQNISQYLGIKGFPTLLFVDGTGAIAKEYKGDRSLQSLLAGICDFYHVCRK